MILWTWNNITLSLWISALCLFHITVLPHRPFLKVLYFFFTISRFCTFFVLFSDLVLFLYFFFINLAGFYQILFKSTVFVLFLEILQN